VLEAELEQLQGQVSEPEFYQQPHEHTEPVLLRLQSAEQELDVLLERWTELDD
jgi:ATP-binding cassette subfamily F protein uup